MTALYKFKYGVKNYVFTVNRNATNMNPDFNQAFLSRFEMVVYFTL